MPPAPDRDSDDADIDEPTGYSRSDDVTGAAAPAARQEERSPRGRMIDAHGRPAVFDMTPSAFLVTLRRLAAVMGLDQPTALDAVPAALVDMLRQEQATGEEPY